MDPTRAALHDLLTGAVRITELLADGTGGVWFRTAPMEAGQPLVSFDRAGPTRAILETFGNGGGCEAHVWVIKGIVQEDTPNAAEDIAEAIDLVVHDTPLPISRHRTLWLRREQRVEYEELDGQVRWQHAGGMYRLISERL